MCDGEAQFARPTGIQTHVAARAPDRPHLRPRGRLVIALPYLIAPFYRFVDPVSTLMLWRWATGARVERAWTPLSRIAPALPLAVIVAEDGRFCRHHGVDFPSCAT